MTGVSSEATEDAGSSSDHYDAVVVGCGPAGGAAGVFLARYGLDTVAFDRGSASLDRCAFLENYPGFPAGIDIDTFQGLLRHHAREAGVTLVDDLVESVEGVGESDGDDEATGEDGVDATGASIEGDGDARFAVETQDDRRVTAEFVVAATRYTGEYMRPLGGDELFEVHEHHGEEHEHFDRDYADSDGRTPVDGLYVASPSGEPDVQAVVAAGRGAHVARSVLEDYRADLGYPGPVAKHYDWVRPDSEFDGEWGDRDRWRESFEERAPDDHDVSDDRFEELREAYVDRAFETHRSPEEVADLTDRAHRRLIEHLDDDIVLERAAEIESERDGDSETAPGGDDSAG